MRCKKCEAMFFMDRSGKIVLGDPDVVLKKGAGKGAATKTKKKDEVYATSFTELLLKLPLPAKLVILGVILFGALQFSGALRKIQFGPKPIPNDLVQRSGIIGDGFVDGKLDRIEKVALPGTSDQIKKWYDDLRPQFKFEGPQGLGKTVQMTAAILKEDTSSATVQLDLLFLTPKPLPEVTAEKKAKVRKENEDPGYKWNGAFTVPLIFTKSGDVWMLDPAKTYQAAQPKPKEKDTGKKK
jgi:hypothetical protein